MVSSVLLSLSIVDFVIPISCPRILWSSWHVMTTIEDKMFLDCKRLLGFRAVLNVQWRRRTRCGHVARADWWSCLHAPWVSRCFSVFWALVFKLSFPFVSPFTFSNFFNHCSKFLLFHLFLQLFRPCSGNILWIFLRLSCTFSRYVSLFLFLYFLFLHNLL